MSYPLFLTKLLIRIRLACWLPSVRRIVDGGGTFLPYYSDRVLSAPVPALRNAATLLERHASDAVDLSLGEPHFDLLSSGSTKLPADQRGWPPQSGLPELRSVIAEKVNTENGLNVNQQDEVLITSGATGAGDGTVSYSVDPNSGPARTGTITVSGIGPNRRWSG